jgi:hypothetical protein
MIDRQRVLVWYLRGYAIVLLAALVATVMPTRWLALGYEWCGLGDWPGEPLLEYLARTESAMYALVGGITLLMSFDVDRYRPLILLLGWVSVLGSVYLFVLDRAIGMPGWWMLAEGPTVLITGVVLLVLARRPSP